MGKESTKAALDRYFQRQLDEANRVKRKNKAPEKDLSKDVMIWLQAHGFSCNVIESKAVYQESAGRYIGGQVVQGMPDIVGNDCAGRAVYIELKAPGKRSTLKEHQRAFLGKKILSNCFAVCIDSIDDLAIIYTKWIELNGANAKVTLLAEYLPRAAKPRDDNSGSFLF